MPLYYYRAIGEDGEIQTGALETPSREAAVQALQAQGVMPIRLGTEKPATSLKALLDTEITPRDALRPRDRIAFTRMLATLTGAALPLDRALEMVRDFGASRGVKALGARLLAAVRSGQSLSDALDADRAGFPPAYRGVIRAGEAGAALDATLARLADQLEAAAIRRAQMQNALIYPGFLVVTAIGSIAVLLAFVVPTFEPLLAEAGVAPPLLTEIVITAGRAVAAYWAHGLAVAAIGLVAFRLWLRAPRRRTAYHAALLRLPLIGPIWRKAETGRLARLLGALLENGVALPEALRLSRDGLSNAAFAAMIARIAPEVEEGQGLAQPMAASGLLPAMALQLVQVGQESGRLTEMLLKTADIFEAEASRDIDRALAFLTPTITLAMGAVIATIVSSILLALFRINALAA